MARTTPNVGLKVWDLTSDNFVPSDLAANWDAIDAKFGIVAPGTTLAFQQFTSSVSVTATTEGTANTVVTAPAYTFNGTTTAWVRFWCPGVTKGTTNINFVVYDGASSIGGGVIGITATTKHPIVFEKRITPTAAAHTYSVRAWVDAGTGSAIAGTGAAGTDAPGFIRVTKE